MKKLFLSLALLGSISIVSAQDLPKPSPSGSLSQRVGLTDIKVDYSRPGVNDRVVIGGLVPYGKLWRTGANMNTTIEFSTSVKIQGQILDKGKYAVFTIPEPEMWMVIFSRKTDHWGTSDYSDANDVLRAEAKVVNLDQPVETFTIDINDIKGESANLVFTWENTRASIPMEFEVVAQAKENIETALYQAEEVDKWKIYRNAANYYHNSNIDSDMALKYINLSIEGNEDSWYSYWLKGEILASKEDYKGAVKAAKQSKKVGEKEAKESGKEFGYAELIDADIKKWEAMK